MNKSLSKRITHYLTLDTNYAIILNGDYGIGKTHFIKHELFSDVKKVEIPGASNTAKYVPVIISLFGVKSIYDIERRILYALYPILKNKGTKILTGLGKGVLKHFGADIDKFVEDSEFTSGNLINYKKVLLCIDDIDRKSRNLEIKDFFGFINNLVENSGAKVLLVANEEILREENNEDRMNYRMLREKVIGTSITYKPQTDAIYDAIVKKMYENSDGAYYNFLLKYKPIIINTIKQNQNNLRNLIFFFEHFRVIQNELQALFNSKETLKNLKEDLENKILNFTLPVSIEYKTGRLNSSNQKEIKGKYQGTFFDIDAFIGDEDQIRKDSNDEGKKYLNEYSEKYIKNSEFKLIYFDSIFQYILGNEFFDNQKLEIEINSYYNFEGENITDKHFILQKLNYWECVNLRPIEYKKLTSKMLKYIDKGEFLLEQYPSLLKYAVRFGNPLGYNIKNLIVRFKKGIKKGTSHYEYVSHLGFKMHLDKTAEFYNEIKDVSEYCIKINQEIEKDRQKANSDALFQLLKNKKFDDFINLLNDKQEEFRYNPVFSHFNANQFWRAIKKLQNSQIIQLAFELESRYQVSGYDGLSQEKSFVVDLENNVSGYLKRKSLNTLDKIAYKILHEKIVDALSHFRTQQDISLMP